MQSQYTRTWGFSGIICWTLDGENVILEVSRICCGYYLEHQEWRLPTYSSPEHLNIVPGGFQTLLWRISMKSRRRSPGYLMLKGHTEGHSGAIPTFKRSCWWVSGRVLLKFEEVSIGGIRKPWSVGPYTEVLSGRYAVDNRYKALLEGFQYANSIL